MSLSNHQLHTKSPATGSGRTKFFLNEQYCDTTLDHELDFAWLNLKIQGTRFMQAKQIERRVLALNLRDKKANLAGLQLADLVVTPIGRKVLGKTVKEDYQVVEQKFRRSPKGKIDGYGLVVLPK